MKDGKPEKDKNGKIIYEPYKIKVLNTINFKKSMHYNPFMYIRSEKDIFEVGEYHYCQYQRGRRKIF